MEIYDENWIKRLLWRLLHYLRRLFKQQQKVKVGMSGATLFTFVKAR